MYPRSIVPWLQRGVATRSKYIYRDASALPQRLSVTSFKTQICELREQFYLERNTKRVSTDAMNRGTRIHNKIDEYYAQGKIAEIRLDGLENVYESDRYAKKLIDLAEKFDRLSAGDTVRELRVVGEVSGIILTGIIDQVGIDETGRLSIRETKTSSFQHAPQVWKQRIAYHQTTLYHHLLSKMLKDPQFDILKYVVRDEFDLKTQLHPNIVSVYPSLHSLECVYTHILQSYDDFKKLNLELSQEFWVDFIDKGDMKNMKSYCYNFDSNMLEAILEFRLDLFRRLRDPLPVDPECTSVCVRCPFVDECPA